MAARQSRAEVDARRLERMRATRERIDLKLKLIRARATAARTPLGRVAQGLSAISAVAAVLAKRKPAK